VHPTNNELGRIGEDVATVYLQDMGYEILDRNWRFKRVELDIVARKDSTLIFCEVKTRRSVSHGAPSDAITSTKLQHIRTAALHWLANNQSRHNGIRFDAISVIHCAGQPTTISHIKGIEL
jgi:putative endonuclease